MIDIAMAVINKKLANMRIEWSTDACLGVVMASGGYPGDYKPAIPSPD